MSRRITSPLIVLLSSIVIVAGGMLQPAQYLSSFAQPGCQTFKETGKTVCGRFLEYWNTHGGLAQQGFPISDELKELSPTDGKTYTVQYFERAAFEGHPEFAPPNDVLLSLLGSFLYKQKYPNGAPSQNNAEIPGARYFPETGKRVGGGFLTYWNTHGGLAQEGFPISNEFTERSETDGKSYTVQYFERAVFEYHPDKQPPYDVLLSLLGSFRYKQVYGTGSSGPTPGSQPCSNTTNIAAAANGGSIAGASSNYGGRWDQSLLIDGKADTGWAGTRDKITNQYVIVALPGNKTYTINKVRLNPSATGGDQLINGLKDFQIRVSATDANPGSFTTVFAGTATGENKLLEYTFASVQAKYVMIFAVNNQGGDYVEIAEFEVYAGCQ